MLIRHAWAGGFLGVSEGGMALSIIPQIWLKKK